MVHRPSEKSPVGRRRLRRRRGPPPATTPYTGRAPLEQIKQFNLIRRRQRTNNEPTDAEGLVTGLRTCRLTEAACPGPALPCFHTLPTPPYPHPSRCSAGPLRQGPLSITVAHHSPSSAESDFILTGCCCCRRRRRHARFRRISTLMNRPPHLHPSSSPLPPPHPEG